MNPMECNHPELMFASGAFYVFCPKCQQYWEELEGSDQGSNTNIDSGDVRVTKDKD